MSVQTKVRHAGALTQASVVTPLDGFPHYSLFLSPSPHAIEIQDQRFSVDEPRDHRHEQAH